MKPIFFGRLVNLICRKPVYYGNNTKKLLFKRSRHAMSPYISYIIETNLTFSILKYS